MTRFAVLRWLLSVLVVVGCASGEKSAAVTLKPAEIDETTLMEKIRTGAKSDPTSALALAEVGERRFGDTAFAEERSALAIQALINSDRIGAARSRAYQFLERYPNGPYSAHVAAMTGVHATPRGPAGSP
jgi:TolA-binding protein